MQDQTTIKELRKQMGKTRKLESRILKNQRGQAMSCRVREVSEGLFLSTSTAHKLRFFPPSAQVIIDKAARTMGIFYHSSQSTGAYSLVLTPRSEFL